MNSINSVDVLSIDEEKLKFRVNITFNGNVITPNRGEYKFLLPIPTALANSNRYDQCVIQCNGFQAYANIGDPTWSNTGALLKAGVIELQLDVPSSQATTTTSLSPADSGVGLSRVGGYRELLFLEINSIGDVNGNVALAGPTAAWFGSSKSEPIMCGNPFGKTITIINFDPVNDTRIWLVSNAAGGGAGGADVGNYTYSFDITMIENK